MSGRKRVPTLRDLDIYRLGSSGGGSRSTWRAGGSFGVQPIERELEQENQARRINASANMGIHRINIPLTTEHECRQELVADERPIRGAKKYWKG
jgi:hypothetical protein